jgi:hypothetical protein
VIDLDLPLYSPINSILLPHLITMDFLKKAAEKATGGSEHKQENNNEQNDDYVDKGM